MIQTSSSPTPKNQIPNYLQIEPKSAQQQIVTQDHRSSHNWFSDLPLGRKHLWGALAPAVISLLGLGGVSIWLLHQNSKTHLVNQAKSELEIISTLTKEQLEAQKSVLNNNGYTALYSKNNANNLEPELNKLVQTASFESIVTLPANIQGQDYLLAAKLLKNNQVLVRGIPQNGLNQLALPLGATGLAIGFNLLMALLFRKAVTKRIEQLNTNFQRFNQGQSARRVKVTGADEIGQLATAFNSLADEVQTSRQGLSLETEQARILGEMAVIKELDEGSLSDLLTTKLEEARSALGLDRLLIYYLTLQGSGHVAQEALAYGCESTLEASIDNQCIPKSLLEAYQKGRIVPIRDTSNANFHPDHFDLMKRLGVKANLILPILSQGELFGLLIGHDCHQTHEWNQKEINFLKQLSTQIGIAIDRIALQRKQRTEAQLTQNLQNIILKIAGALNAEAIFNTAISEIRTALSVDRVIIYRFDETWQGKIIAESVGDDWPTALGATIADPCLAQKYVERYKRGRVQATPDIYNAGLTDCHIQQLAPFAVKANLVAPILVQDNLIGLLIAHQCSGPRNWEQREIDLFSQLSSQVSLALERTAILESQRQSAEEQRKTKEQLQQRALQLMMDVYPASQGDLTVQVNVTPDEIGTIAESYNTTIDNLRTIVSRVQQAAAYIQNTTQINQGFVEQLSVNTQRQTHEIVDTLDRLGVMTESVRNVAVNAERAETAIIQATRKVEVGEQAINRTVNGMLSIRNTVAETAEKVKQLGESSQKISKVISLIGKFAAQTHLLALKASIEAARAGEEGRGFAVIADEVRSLASQSAEATGDIKRLVGEIQTVSKDLTIAMENEREQIVEGTTLVEATRESLNQITVASAKINQLVVEIAKTTVEQSHNSTAITQTMGNLAAIAHDTSTSAEKPIISFQQLLTLAQELQEDTAKFKVR